MKKILRKIFFFCYGPEPEAQEITFHPEFKMPIKFVFYIGNKPYYQCVNDYEMPAKRMAFAKKFYGEMENKITTEVLLDFISATRKHINSGELGKADRLMDELEYRAKWLFEPESTLRFASVIYFDLTENLADYDFEYNQQKINGFQKKKMLGRFLQLRSNWDSILLSLSEADLQEYLLKLQPLLEIHQKLTSEAKDTNSK